MHNSRIINLRNLFVCGVFLAAIFSMYRLDAKKIKSKNKMKVNYSYRKKQPIIVALDLTECNDLSGPVKIVIYDDDWCIKHSTVIDKPKRTRYRNKFDSSMLIPRGYVLKVTRFDKKGKPKEVFTSSFRIPDESQWMNNKIGISKRVPAPFTPLKVEGNIVSCWGRKYYLGQKGVLLDKIITRGKEILQSPIRFGIKQQSETPKLISQAGEFIKKSDTEVIYQITQKYRDFKISSKLTIEYDGMVRFDSNIDPAKNIEISSLKLIIPFKKKYATLYNISAALGNSKYVSGVLHPQKGWNGIFHPLVWLGDEDRGLLWFAEWIKDWAVKDEEGTIRIVPGKNATDMIITMIDTKKEFKKNKAVCYTFGLQASPVKPMAKDWRTLDRISWKNPKDAPKKITKGTMPLTFTYTSSGGWPPIWGYVLERSDEAKYFKHREYIKSLGIAEITYTFIDNIKGNLPEFRYYFEEWYNGSAISRYAEIKNTGIDSRYKNLSKINCEARSWIDFCVWQHAKAAKKFDLDGYYYDLAMPYPSWNVKSGCRYTDFNGKIKGKHSIFSRREIARRIYTALREMKNQKQTYILGHDSGNPHFLPVTAFCDLSYNGEQYAHHVRKNPDDYSTFDYSKFLDLGQLRAQHTGRQFGVFPLLLPMLRNIPAGDLAYPGIDKYTEILYSFFGIHDINIEWKPQIWRWFLDVRVAKKYEDMKRKFDMRDKDLEFIPYWNNQGMFEIIDEDYGPLVDRDREGVHMSVYLRKKDKKALLMISNLDKKAHPNKEIKLNLKKMGLPENISGIDHEGKVLVINGDILKINLKPQTFKVIEIKGGKK